MRAGGDVLLFFGGTQRAGRSHFAGRYLGLNDQFWGFIRAHGDGPHHVINDAIAILV